MKLCDIPPASVAICERRPQDCPVSSADLILRLPDGSFDPPIDTKHPTFTGPEHLAASFRVLAQGLTPADIEALQLCRWQNAHAQSWSTSLRGLAEAIGAFRAAEAQLGPLLAGVAAGERSRTLVVDRICRS